MEKGCTKITGTTTRDGLGNDSICLTRITKDERRSLFYTAINHGFYEAPPEFLMRSNHATEPRFAIRIPLPPFIPNRFHWHVMMANSDLTMTAKKKSEVTCWDSHSDLLYIWYSDRFHSIERVDSDAILEQKIDVLNDEDRIVEFRDSYNCLTGACLLGLDKQSGTAHAFYHYYDTSQSQRRIGYAMLLTIMSHLQQAGYRYFYPGIYSLRQNGERSPFAYKATLSDRVEAWRSHKGWRELEKSERPRMPASPGFRIALRQRPVF